MPYQNNYTPTQLTPDEVALAIVLGVVIHFSVNFLAALLAIAVYHALYEFHGWVTGASTPGNKERSGGNAEKTS